MATLYISGRLSDDRQEVRCSLQSSVVLFIATYSHSDLKVVFVSDSNTDSSPSADDYICCYEMINLSHFCSEFSAWQDLPASVRNVSLPSIHQPEQRLVRSGLCVVLRHIIKDAHSCNPSLNLIDVLGFKQGCMKMCAEVSSWTKLCEVDIPLSVTQFMTDLQGTKLNQESNNRRLVLPSELMTLDNHFNQKCLIHNDNKRYRAEIARLKEIFTLSTTKDATAVETEMKDDSPGCRFSSQEMIGKLNSAAKCQEQSLSFDSLTFDGSRILINQTVYLKHGVRKFKVDRDYSENVTRSTENTGCKEHSVTSTGDAGVKSSEGPKEIGVDSNDYNVFDLSALQSAVMDLSFMDVEYERLYSEGIELTVADLILITYIYHLLNVMNFALIQSFSKFLPSIVRWTQHMVSLPHVQTSGRSLGWNFLKLKSDLHRLSQAAIVAGDGEGVSAVNSSSSVAFQVEEKNEDEEEIELSRNNKMKHRAIKPEVLQALQKFQTVGIQAVTGRHPKGDTVQVDWNAMPDGVHPKQGNVPVKRTERKCQQLENLATAVTTIARPGDVIVDFCSGGGHLGILCAYLLPECQVFLVENKEESLLKSWSRLQSLGLTNVTLYQCNMDYFVGRFGVGLCLHACGSATDMVLELCTKSRASFVICPCCYGGIHNTHLLAYPRSQRYQEADISYTDFLTIGHAADQTEFDIKLEKQGRACMNLVDTDRAEYAKQHGYDVTLCSLQPLTCSPKNNLLIGTLSNNSNDCHV